MVLLHTRRLTLRELTQNDTARADLYEAISKVVVPDATHAIRAFTDSQRIRAERSAKTRRVFEFAILQSVDSQLIGRCGMEQSEVEQTEAMLWYALAQDAWGHGYAVEAAQAVLRFGFEELRLHRIFVDIDPRNGASLRVAEKLGLRREGHFLETTWSQGEWTDSVIFALLDREYRARGLKAPTRASRRG
ncbi:MAG TPA: GNAT family protein [Polyangiaceae bacterium]|nr:GNAT family protein [Polyangiaceae bacterium]